MTLHALNGRIAKLEAQSAPPDPDAITRTRTLIVWRRPEDTESAACARWGIDPSAWRQVIYRLAPQSGRFAAHPEQLRPAFLPGPDEDWTAILTLGHAQLEARRRQWQDVNNDARY